MRRPRLEYMVACCAVCLLLWACYDYGAFLSPARTVVAIAAPALGLAWAAGRLLVWHRARPTGAAEASRVGTVVAADAVGAAATGAASRAMRVLPESLLCALAAFGALSALWSLDWSASLRAAGLLFGGCVYLHLGRRIGAASINARCRLLFPLAAAGIALSLLSVVAYASHWWRFSLEKDGVLATTGTFGYANALAGFLILTVAATFALYLEDQRRPRRAPAGLTDATCGEHTPSRLRVAVPLLLAGAVGVQVAAFVLAWSKGAALAVVILLVLLVAARAAAATDHAQRRRWLAAVLIVLLVGGLATGGLLLWNDVAPQMAVSGLPPPDADPEDILPMSADAYRVKTWGAALGAARERPVAGYGLDTFYQAYAPFKLGGHTAYAHNVVIQHLVEVGGIGTALLLAFLLVATLGPIRTLLGALRDPRIPLVLGAQAFVLHNLVDLTWYFPAIFFTFALVLGLALSCPKQGAESPPIVSPVQPAHPAVQPPS